MDSPTGQTARLSQQQDNTGEDTNWTISMGDENAHLLEEEQDGSLVASSVSSTWPDGTRVLVSNACQRVTLFGRMHKGRAYMRITLTYPPWCSRIPASNAFK